MTPHRTALIFEDERQTYGGLYARATRLAQGLSSLGVRSRDRVGFLGPNHPANLETLFACSLLGAIAVPLHFRFTASELVHAINDAACKVLIFAPQSAARLEELHPRLRVEHYVSLAGGPGAAVDYQALLESASEEPIDRPVREEDTCLINYTSGTTGLNKGVMLSHRNLEANVFNFLSCTDYLADDVMLISAPLYRVGGLGTLLPIFFKGAAAVILADFHPEEALRLIERHRVTILFNGPRQFAQLAGSPRFKEADLSSVRFCMCGGDTLPEGLIHQYLERGLTFLHCYGLTETASLSLLLAEEDTLDKHGSVGRPPLLMDARVVGEDLSDVRPGEIGELLVRGPNVMQGYWEQPQATDSALRDGWLRTGDAARMDEEGYVFILDRVKDAMVLSQGKVYPHQVEGVLAQHPAVSECAAFAFATGPEAPEQIAAFVVPTEGAQATPGELQSFCAQRLPQGQVPARIGLVRELPRNCNGKLLRRRMRELLEESERGPSTGRVGTGV